MFFRENLKISLGARVAPDRSGAKWAKPNPIPTSGRRKRERCKKLMYLSFSASEIFAVAKARLLTGDVFLIYASFFIKGIEIKQKI